MNIGTVGFLISILSLYVAIRVAWDTRFKPAKLVSLFSRISVWSQESDNGLTSKAFVPVFWIRNLGAKPAIVSNLRLKIECINGDVIFARPESRLTAKTIIEGSNITYSEKDQKTFPINLDEMFTGFSLLSGETWHSNYSFYINDDEYHKLRGESEVTIQVQNFQSKVWKSIGMIKVDFENRLTEHNNSGRELSLQLFHPK